jgi:hypothetical protein
LAFDAAWVDGYGAGRWSMTPGAGARYSDDVRAGHWDRYLASTARSAALSRLKESGDD